MSREKQIEEMARDIFAPKVAIDGIDIAFAAVHGADKPDSHFMRIAQHLYNAGYRKQSEGENIGTVHPVDEFICSECGIVLEGWTRVVTDEDDGELYYYEYAFKYCPNCGAKMKGGEE